MGSDARPLAEVAEGPLQERQCHCGESSGVESEQAFDPAAPLPKTAWEVAYIRPLAEVAVDTMTLSCEPDSEVGVLPGSIFRENIWFL